MSTTDPIAADTAPPDTGDDLTLWAKAILRIGDGVDQLVNHQTRQRRRNDHGDMAPVFASKVVPASGTVVLDLGTPARGRQWVVERLFIYDQAAATGAATGAAVWGTGTVAGGSSGGLALPAGASITGFDLTFLPAAATVSGTVTVTGMATGLNFEAVNTTTGGGLSERFPTPLPPTNASTQITVSVPAITGGAGYALNVYGTSAASAGVGWWYAGSPAAYGTQEAIAQISSLPQLLVPFRPPTITPNDRLFAVLTGATPGDTIVARADVVATEARNAPTVRAI